MEPLKTKPIKEKSFADEVRAFFGMEVKKPKPIKSAEEGVEGIKAAGGHLPKRGVTKR